MQVNRTGTVNESNARAQGPTMHHLGDSQKNHKLHNQYFLTKCSATYESATLYNWQESRRYIQVA